MKTKEKLNLSELHKEDYVAPKKPVLLTIKKATYLAASGQGEPGGKVFIDRIGALYGAAFTMKMTRKFAGKQDYTVSRLEAQWWADTDDEDFSQVPKEKWCWKLMIRTPEFIKEKELAATVS